MNQTPLIIDPRRLNEGQDKETTLRERGAKYHQSCRLLFSNTKLKQAAKRALLVPRQQKQSFNQRLEGHL